MSIFGLLWGNPTSRPPKVAAGQLSPAERLPNELWADILSRVDMQSLVNVSMVGCRFRALAQDRHVLSAVVSPGATSADLQQRARIARRITAKDCVTQYLGEPPLVVRPPWVAPTRDTSLRTSWPHLSWPSSDLFIKRPLPRRASDPRRPADPRRVVFWDTRSRVPQIAHTEHGAGGLWQHAAASATGETVVVNNASASLVTLMSIAQRPARMVLQPLPARALAQAIDSTGELLAFVPQDGDVRIKPRHADWHLLRTGDAAMRPATALVFCADSSRIGAIYADHTIRIWNTSAAADTPLATIRASMGTPVNCIALSPNGEFVAAGAPNSVAMWAIADPVMRYWGTRHSGNQQNERFGFSPDNRALLVGLNGCLEVVDLQTRQIQSVKGPGTRIDGLSFSPCGGYVLAHDGKAIRFWTLKGTQLTRLKSDFLGSIGEARWSARPGRVNLVEQHGRVVLLDFDVTPVQERRAC